MTMFPKYQTCPKCHKKYSWNPSVGKFICPHCGGLGKRPKLLDVILKGKKKDK